MSDLNRHKSSTSQGSSAFLSLADILSSKSSTKSLKPGQSSTLLPSLEELQKKLDGNQDSAKLNFSRAFNLNSVNLDSFDFESKKANQDDSDKIKREAEELSSQLLNERHPKSNRRQDERNSKKGDGRFSTLSASALNDDINREIIHIINKIEKSKHLNFDDDNKDNKNLKTPDFNLINLPKNFDLDRCRINLYKSGMMELVNYENPPKVFRFKPAFHNSNNVITDLIITTDSLVYVDQANICTPDGNG